MRMPAHIRESMRELFFKKELDLLKAYQAIWFEIVSEQREVDKQKPNDK